MDVADELEDLQELRDALVEARDKADWVARYTESRGVKDFAFAIRRAAGACLDLEDLMVDLVVKHGEE